MFRQATFDPWRSTIMTHVPYLSKSQATGLALWSLGMVLARSCALTAISCLFGCGLAAEKQHRAPTPARVVLRGPGQTRPQPPRRVRRDLFCPRARLGPQWVNGHPTGPCPRCDDLGRSLCGVGHQRGLSGLCHSGGLGGAGGRKKKAWRREWLRMLRQLKAAVPRGWTVLVLADRGL